MSEWWCEGKEKREKKKTMKEVERERRGKRETENTVGNSTTATTTPVGADHARHTMNWIKWCWRQDRSRLPLAVDVITGRCPRTHAQLTRKIDSLMAAWGFSFTSVKEHKKNGISIAWRTMGATRVRRRSRSSSRIKPKDRRGEWRITQRI